MVPLLLSTAIMIQLCIILIPLRGIKKLEFLDSAYELDARALKLGLAQVLTYDHFRFYEVLHALVDILQMNYSRVLDFASTHFLAVGAATDVAVLGESHTLGRELEELLPGRPLIKIITLLRRRPNIDQVVGARIKGAVAATIVFRQWRR